MLSLQFVVYIVTVLKFEAIFLLVCISKPTIFFSRVGNDMYLSSFLLLFLD